MRRLYKFFSLLMIFVLLCTGLPHIPVLAENTQTENTQAGDAKTENNKAENAPTGDTKAEEKVNNAGLNITAKSAVLLEGSTGRIIYEQNKDEKLIPASITKIMTLLLIFEALDKGKIKLEDKVTVSEYAAQMGGSQVYLEPNETQTVADMIKCITIASANDAAVAMAEHISGSETEFVAAMNKKAEELGMKNTHFLNCNGLDDDITSGHYSSAYDVALMSRALIVEHPEISNYSTVWMDSIIHTTKKGESEFGLTNTNKLVRSYNGITGLKTGSTSKAKYCLSATANRNGTDLIAVIMAAPDPKIRFSEAASLLDYGFSNTTNYLDDHKNRKKKKVTVKFALEKSVPAIPAKEFAYTCIGDENPEEITSKVTVKKEITAPIKKNTELGSITYYLKDKEIGSVPLISENEIRKASFLDCLSYIKDSIMIL